MKQLGEQPFIDPSAILSGCTLGAWTEVGESNRLENTEMGDYSYTGPWCIVQNASIGKFSNIAAAVRIGPTQHPMDRPTLHHFTYRRKMYGFDTIDDDDFFAWRRSRMTFIGHDTWLGHGAIVMSGVTVGDGAIIGSGAVVTRDVEPYTIVGGVPAKLIRRRFSSEQSAALQRIKWWDWSYQTIKDRFDSFLLPIDDFIGLYDGEQV